MSLPFHDFQKQNLKFDIKKLNDIEDKVVRGTLKKIYMAGKRNKLSSSEVVDNMINELKVADKLDDSLSEFIKGLK